MGFEKKQISYQGSQILRIGLFGLAQQIADKPMIQRKHFAFA